MVGWWVGGDVKWCDAMELVSLVASLQSLRLPGAWKVPGGNLQLRGAVGGNDH